MELVAIAVARATALIQIQQWDPFGKTSTLEALGSVRNRYSFAKTPTRVEDLDPQKGIELSEGRLGDIRIDRITVFSNGIIIDTRSSTDDSEKVLNDILTWANEAFGAVIIPAWQTFTSQIIFRSEMRLFALNPILPNIADVLSDRASSDLKHPFTFEPTAILFNVDTSRIKAAPAMFTIERRAEIPFTENMYFSNAPLRTEEHIRLLDLFETSLGRDVVNR